MLVVRGWLVVGEWRREGGEKERRADARRTRLEAASLDKGRRIPE